MTVFFDTSVLIPAVVDQLSNHPASLQTFVTYTSGEHTGVTSTHALAECYAVLTRLPIPKRISTAEAQILIKESIAGRLKVASLGPQEYTAAIARVSRHGLAGGIVYDAVHAAVAGKAGCERIYTYNVEHYRLVCDDGIVVSAP